MGGDDLDVQVSRLNLRQGMARQLRRGSMNFFVRPHREEARPYLKLPKGKQLRHNEPSWSWSAHRISFVFSAMSGTGTKWPGCAAGPFVASGSIMSHALLSPGSEHTQAALDHELAARQHRAAAEFHDRKHVARGATVRRARQGVLHHGAPAFFDDRCEHPTRRPR